MRSILAAAEGGSGTATSIYSIGATVGVVLIRRGSDLGRAVASTDRASAVPATVT